MTKTKLAFLIISFFAIISSTKTYAQHQISEQDHAWLMYFGNHRITDKIGIHTEYQFRRNNFLDNWQQSLLRVGVDYYTKSGAILTGGYGWIKSYPYGDQPIAHVFDENRIWEQLILNQKVARFSFQHRYRLEQRFLNTWSKDANDNFFRDGSVYKNRVRYRFMASYPLNKKTMEDNTLFLSAYDEVFAGFGKNISKNVVDQNRLSLNLGYRFNANFNLQIGYLNQYIIKSDGVKAENNHTFQLSYQYNLDFRKR